MRKMNRGMPIGVELVRRGVVKEAEVNCKSNRISKKPQRNETR